MIRNWVWPEPFFSPWPLFDRPTLGLIGMKRVWSNMVRLPSFSFSPFPFFAFFSSAVLVLIFEYITLPLTIPAWRVLTGGPPPFPHPFFFLFFFSSPLYRQRAIFPLTAMDEHLSKVHLFPPPFPSSPPVRTSSGNRTFEAVELKSLSSFFSLPLSAERRSKVVTLVN